MPFQPHWATSTSSSLTNVTIAISISETRSSPLVELLNIQRVFLGIEARGHCLVKFPRQAVPGWQQRQDDGRCIRENL